MLIEEVYLVIGWFVCGLLGFVVMCHSMAHQSNKNLRKVHRILKDDVLYAKYRVTTWYCMKEAPWWAFLCALAFGLIGLLVALAEISANEESQQ